MRATTKRRTSWPLGALACLLSAALGAGTAEAAASAETIHEIVPINISLFVPCANGGAGEIVDLVGPLNTIFHVTFDGSGGFHADFSANPQGVSGPGEVTGDKYQATGITRDSFNAKVGSEETFVNNFRIIGQGNGNNFLVHETFHVTVNANGDMAAFVDNFSIDCK